MPAVIQLQTLGGMLIERVDNGWILRDATMTCPPGFSEPRPVRVAETPDALGKLVSEWATAQHEATQRRNTLVADYAGATAGLS